MTSTFSGITSALSALHAQRRGLDVTGQNIANVNTEGYSRQRVSMQARSGSVTPANWSISNGVGEGVDVTDVQRVRNEFLEGRGRAERAQNAYLAEEARVYAGIESVFAEPSDTALQAQLADLWAGFDDVANNPGDGGARGALLETAATVADGLNNAYSALGSQWGSMRDQLDAHATDVNTAASTIAKLNETIRRARAGDLPVNELADQRDGLLMHLSETIGATAKFRDDGTVDVYLGGSTLVSGANAQRIEVGGARPLEDLGSDPLTVRFAGSGVAAPAGGTMGSATEALPSIIPAYGARLDDVAAK